MYDVMKWITLILLPALSVLYMALAPLWGFPYPTEVAASIAALDAFLAVLLGISTNTFKINNPMYRLSLVKLAGETKNNWILPTNWYDILSWIAQIFLPALAALYAAMAGIWGMPYVDQIVGTIVALDTFLGLLLGFSTAEFHKKVAQACVVAPETWTNLPPVG
jgi:hypothetical protein